MLAWKFLTIRTNSRELSMLIQLSGSDASEEHARQMDTTKHSNMNGRYTGGTGASSP